MIGRGRRHPVFHTAHDGCGKHPLEPAEATCDRCRRHCCGRCSVPVRRRVLCIECGMVLGGIVARRRAS